MFLHIDSVDRDGDYQPYPDNNMGILQEYDPVSEFFGSAAE